MKLAKNLTDLKDVVSSILGMKLITSNSKEGKLVSKVLIAEDIYYLVNRKQTFTFLFY